MQTVVLKAFSPGIGPFKMGKVEMEEPFIIGKSGVLLCSYDLEDSELYSVKWYKDGQEFFRFMPTVSDHTDVFSVAGVTIDLQQSNQNTLHLATMDRDTEGIFMCEVSTEAPHFYTGVEMVSVRVTGEDLSETRETKIIFFSHSFWSLHHWFVPFI